MRKKSKVALVGLLLTVLTITVAYALTYTSQEWFASWKHISPEDSLIQVVDFDGDFTTKLNFTYTVTYLNTHLTETRSADLTFIIYGTDHTEIFRGIDTITDLPNGTTTTIDWTVELVNQTDINTHAQYKLEIDEGLTTP